MTAPIVHLLNSTPGAYRASCETYVALFWTAEAQAVTCPKCLALMDLQPA